MDNTGHTFIQGTLVTVALAGVFGGAAMIQGADGSAPWYVGGWTAIGFGTAAALGFIVRSVRSKRRSAEGAPPALTFGAVDVPVVRQRLFVQDGTVLYGTGIVIRLKVSNTEGCVDAEGVHATLTFEARDGTVLQSNVEGQWENESGVEIALPGTGRQAALDLFAVVEAAGGVYYIWNRHSVAAGLSGPYRIDAGEFWVDVLLRGKSKVRAHERVWVVAAGIPRVGKASDDEPPLWERIESAIESGDSPAVASPEPYQLAEHELVAIINEGEEIAGDLISGDPGWDEITYWTQSAAEFLGAVLGPAAKDRLVRIDSAPSYRELVLDRIDAVRGILDRLEPRQVRVSPDELAEEVDRRRCAPTDFTDWLNQQRNTPSSTDENELHDPP